MKFFQARIKTGASPKPGHRRCSTERTVLLEDPSTTSKSSIRFCSFPSAHHRRAVSFDLDNTTVHIVPHRTEQAPSATNIWWQADELKVIKDDVEKQVAACHCLLDKCVLMLPKDSAKRQACSRLHAYEEATLKFIRNSSNQSLQESLSKAMVDITNMRGFEGRIVPAVGRPRVKEHVRRTLKGRSSPWNKTSSTLAQVRAKADACEAQAYQDTVLSAY